MNSVVNEKAIIGCMMSDEDSRDEGLLTVTAKDFTDDSCRRIFSAIECLTMTNQSIDLVSVCSMFDESFAKTITDIYTSFYMPSQFKYYVNELIKESKLRKFMEETKRIFQKAKDSDEECLLDMQNLLDELNSDRITSMTKISEAIPYAVDDILNEKKGIKTGFTQLDKYTKGLVKGNLVVVAGRPSMGKSAFAENIALNVAKQGKVVAFFSLEMKNTVIAQRLLYMHNRVGEREMLTNQQTAGKKVINSINDFDDMKFYCYDAGGLNTSKLKTFCKKVQKKEKELDLVVVDYIGLMQTVQRKNSSRALEVGEVAHSLKQLAQEMNCTVMVLSQLNRSVDARSEHIPMLSDLRESGDIEQDADIVLFPFRPSVYDDEVQEIYAQLFIAKNRNGATGKIDLYWSGEHFLFDNPATEEEEFVATRFKDVTEENGEIDGW